MLPSTRVEEALLLLMLASAREGSPLLILSDSGGAASALAEYKHTGVVSDASFSGLEEKLQQLRISMGGSMVILELLHAEETPKVAGAAAEGGAQPEA